MLEILVAGTPPEKDEFARYLEVTSHGLFYQYILGVWDRGMDELARERLGDGAPRQAVHELAGELSRDSGMSATSVKLAVQRAFFSSNRATATRTRDGQPRPAGWVRGIIRHEFPTLHAVQSVIRRNDRSLLALILQSLEAFVVVHCICRRIHRERPDIVLFTLHDALVTVPAHAAYVRDIMRQETGRLFGTEATVKISGERAV